MQASIVESLGIAARFLLPSRLALAVPVRDAAEIVRKPHPLLPRRRIS